LGRANLKWLALAACSGLALSLVDLGVFSILTELMRALGLTEEGHPSTELSVGALFVALILLGVSRSLALFVVRQGAAYAFEQMVARLRVVGTYALLNSDSERAPEVTTFHQNMDDTYPKTAHYVRQRVQIVSTTLHLGVLGLWLLWVDLRAFGLAIGAMTVIGLVVLSLKRGILKQAKELPGAHEEIVRSTQRLSRNWILIRVARIADSERARFDRQVMSYARRATKTNLRVHLSSAIPSALGIIVLAGTLFAGVRLWEMTSPVLVGFIYILFRFIQSCSQLANQVGTALSFKPHYKNAIRGLGHLDAEAVQCALGEKAPDISRPSKQAELRSAPPSIHLEGVCFSYPEHRSPIVNGLSVTVPSGGQLAIVGKSGAGKTTLLRLIAGVLRPKGGAVRFDDVPAHQHRFTAAYVGSEPHLVLGSVRDNLVFGSHADPDDAQCWEALKSVGLTEVIERDALALDAPLSPESMTLSLGEQQRLCFARALVTRPHVLFLDEMSANLDEQTQELIINALERLRGQTTCVIVSHRRQMIRHATHILMLEAGGEYTLKSTTKT